MEFAREAGEAGRAREALQLAELLLPLVGDEEARARVEALSAAVGHPPGPEEE